MEITKILFVDIETAGCTSTYDDLTKLDPRRGKLWSDWQQKYKEANEKNGLMDLNSVWVGKAGLHAEYGKVVCVSFGYFDADMVPKIQSFYGDDEKEILSKSAIVLNNADQKGWTLAGHNIKRFDVVYLWKRMLAIGIKPPAMIAVWDKKPWDMRFFDTAEVWSDGAWKESFTSLDTLSAVLDIPTSKDAIKGNMVHNAYWVQGLAEKIKEYCEKDVVCTMRISEKLFNLLK